MDFTCIFFWNPIYPCRSLVCLWKRLPSSFPMENMPQKEKDKLRIIPLCRNIGGIITLNGVIFLVKGFLPLFSSHWFVYAMIAWMILAGLDVWYIEKSNRYRRP